MKNLVVLFVVFFSLVLVSCSDVSDNSMLTNPIMEKSIVTGIETPSPEYPYPYLYSFSEINDFKVNSPVGESVIDFYLPSSVKYSQVYVIVEFANNESTPKTIFINEITNASFRIPGITIEQTLKVRVYGQKSSTITADHKLPYNNNASLLNVVISKWKISDRNIAIQCSELWPSNLSFAFAEIITLKGNFYLFLERPYLPKFEIPEYGKYGVKDVKLFGYSKPTESELTVK